MSKKQKSTYRLTRYINTYASHEVFPIYMQPKQNIPILGEDENISNNDGLYENKKSILEEQDIEKNHKNLEGKSLNTRSRAKNGLSRRNPQARLFKNLLSSSLKEVRFNIEEFATGILVSNIKYNEFGFQNNNLFYLFHNQLNYGLAKYFAKSEIAKNILDKFLSELLMALLTEKLFY